MIRCVPRLETGTDADYPISLAFSPQDIALIMHEKNIFAVARAGYASRVWDCTYKLIPYYDSKKRFVDASLFWFRYLDDREGSEIELRAAMKDAEGLGMELRGDDYEYDFDTIDLYFKKIRIELTVDDKDYVRRKLRGIIRAYGYERRSSLLMEYISKCLECYGLEVSMYGREKDIYDLDIDDMVTIRMKKGWDSDLHRTAGKSDSLFLPDDPNVIITQFSSPKKQDELEFYYNKNSKKTDLDMILGNEREIIWSVDRITKPGDIILFLCHKDSERILQSLYQYTYDRTLRNFAGKKKEIYEDNAGKILAIGVAAEKPVKEGDEYMGLVKDFTLLENPVSQEEFESYISVNMFGPVTRVSEHNWLKLKGIIKEKNPVLRI